MAKYRAKGLTFVDGSLKRAGEEFESDAKPSEEWERIGGKQGVKEGTADDGLDDLRAEFEKATGRKPHHMMKAETLRQGIAEARAAE